jgi:L-alanine-DL-glutamate epimerase-like enolase superfamily enzyme
MATYDTVAGLPLTVESVSCEHREVSVRDGAFTRATTIVVLRGAGEEGIGEDVTYDAAAHEPFQVRLRAGALPLAGEWENFDAFSRSLDSVELFDAPPTMNAFTDYRRWALESAALDLALRQAGRSLVDAVGREPRPVSFVVSFGLGDPPSAEPVRSWLELYPGMRFKLDGTSAWTDELVAELAATGAVDTIDLKGAYRGTPVDQAPDARLYRLVAEGFPEAWIEDPNLDDEAAAAALAPHRERITWDAPIHSVDDVESLAFPPRTINVKPSRFGSVRRLLDAYDYCAEHGIGIYGGGQFELGPGREQIQYLASLFHPDGSNDIAPREYNRDERAVGLPTSPLEVRPDPVGFRWE